MKPFRLPKRWTSFRLFQRGNPSRSWLDLVLAATGTSLATIALSYTGLWQELELHLLDQFFLWRSPEPKDERITIITIDDEDINHLQQWPLSDTLLVNLLNVLDQHQARVIGLNIYRDFPIEPGDPELEQTFRRLDHLIGVYKKIAPAIPPPPSLAEAQRVGFADIILDTDGRVRRSILTIQSSDQGTVESHDSFATKVALMYLANEGVTMEPQDEAGIHVQLGKANFWPLRSSGLLQQWNGGYLQMRTGGYQVLLNYRGTRSQFDTIALTALLGGDYDPAKIRDRIVLIGTTAASLNDLSLSPYSASKLSTSPDPMPGVVIHANAISQIVSAALDGRPLLYVWNEPWEWLWVWGWSVLSATVGFQVMRWSPVQQRFRVRFMVMTVLLGVIGAALVGSAYGLFLWQWWVPSITALLSITGSATLTMVYYSHQLHGHAYLDSLTNIPNRRYLHERLQSTWHSAIAKQQSLAIILCDIDHFKTYNDTYGHNQGDHCLQQVAQAIAQAVRPQDLAARHGGEEFIVLLPKTTAHDAVEVAEAIRLAVKGLQISHSQSSAADHVTLSLGVACGIPPAGMQDHQLIEQADQALYMSKHRGRDRVTLQPDPLDSPPTGV
jgi:diguanylate cyclase (GGDEF)-like protein